MNTTVHGTPIVVNFGYTYPIFGRRFYRYNWPLVELVWQAASAAGGPINFIDVGAAVGDTVILVESNCPNLIAHFWCVDGDAEFSDYLRHNLGHRSNGTLVSAQLSADSGMERELTRVHAGTASAQGKELVPTRTLDALFANAANTPIHVLKIDVDGFDGRVLAGGRQLLMRDKPTVIFEWHPGLCQQTGNSWTEAFEVLQSTGYDRFVWFTKFGNFSHFTGSMTQSVLDVTAQLCLRDKHEGDWHYDVVALPAHSQINPLELAEFPNARRRLSPV